jgi:hypothetical protein
LARTQRQETNDCPKRSTKTHASRDCQPAPRMQRRFGQPVLFAIFEQEVVCLPALRFARITGRLRRSFGKRPTDAFGSLKPDPAARGNTFIASFVPPIWQLRPGDVLHVRFTTCVSFAPLSPMHAPASYQQDGAPGPDAYPPGSVPTNPKQFIANLHTHGLIVTPRDSLLNASLGRAPVRNRRQRFRVDTRRQEIQFSDRDSARDERNYEQVEALQAQTRYRSNSSRKIRRCSRRSG